MQTTSSDDDLRLAVGKVFDAYDIDHSGTLQVGEVINLINDAMKHMKQDRSVSQEQVKQFLALVDQDGDGNISKDELFQLFRQVIDSQI